MYSRANGAGPTNPTTGNPPPAAPSTFSTQQTAPSSPLSQSSSTSSSYYDAPHGQNQQHPNLIRMHSNDSLYQSSEAGGYAASPPRSNANQPGPQYSQHGGNPGSAMHSPLMARREVAPPQPLQYAPPPQPQMLVDPNTGQQYYFPSAPQPLYYPMVPAPMYYAPAQVPPGYVMSHHPHQPQPPQSPTHARAMYFRQPSYGGNYPPPGHAPMQQPPTSSGYFVEHPPSSNVSVCEPEYFSRSHASRHSMESGSSGSIKEDFRQNARDSSSASPKPVTSFAEIPSSSQHSQQSSQYGGSNTAHPPIGGKFSTTSSCTSGFASGAGESTADTMFNSSFASTKNRPVWWGATETSTRIGLDEMKQTPSPVRSSPEDRTPTLSHQSSIGASQPAAEVDRSSPASEPAQLPSKAPVAKAIRMDIDLSAPITPVESPKPKPRPATASTAFTVTFDPPAAAKKPVSLQDAAAANGRRFATRRSLPASKAAKAAAAEVESESETQDPKHYLFNKMIQGLRKPPEKTQAIPEAVANKKPDMDTLSEAGTYIVESRRKPESDNNDADDDNDSEDDNSSRFEDDSDSDSTVSPTEASSSAPVTQRQPSAPAPRLPPPKTSLLTARLQQLNLRNTRNSSTPAAPAPAPTSTARSIRPCQRPSTAATPAAPANNNFRNHTKCRCQSETRGDGGRFSMRSGPSAVPFNPPSTRNSTGSNNPAARPPFKSGPAAPSRRSNATVAVGTPGPSKETPEMAAWLRRKGYDPRKSAVEARKIQALKARLLHLTTGGHNSTVSSSSRPGTAPQHDELPGTEDMSSSYLSNRSMSFHPDGGNNGFPSVSSRNNKSHDDLSHVGEDDESFSGVENKKTNAELERKVDEINEKCLRSIQMIKLYSQNTISDSVENLLERVVQPDGQESVTDQLSRLGSAFEAIQKYFEERSGSVSPPASARRGTVTVADSQRPRTVSTDPSIRDSASSASSAAGSRHLRLL
uniref:USP domain-containing protein n=1 Tax=Panagrellus redivivus TaxID=6233 RepID=A0A7E4V997_PANRE